MKIAAVFSAALLSMVFSAVAAPPPPWLLENTTPAPQKHLIWQTEPGVRYDLWKSDDLQTWTQVPGYPAVADGLSKEYTFTPGSRGFFRFYPIDEQPPVIAAQFPADDGFAVGRFADLSIQLEDASDIDPGSIHLTVGSLGTFSVGSLGFAYANKTITFDSGDVALGAYGQTVTATLVAADTKGNTLNYSWSFRLEIDPQVSSNVYVFGSPTAQRAGQRVSGPAAALASRFASGPIKMNGSADPWSIETVEADRIVIAYTPGNPPAFTAGQLVCNLVPTKESEVFYRRVLSVSDDTGASQLTLMTEDVSLGEFVTEGSVSITPDSVIYQLDGSGSLVRALSVNRDLTFPASGIDLSGAEIKLGSGGDFEATVLGVRYQHGNSLAWIDITANELSWWLTPSIHLGIELHSGHLQSFDAVASGNVSINNAFDVDVTGIGASVETTIFDLPTNLEPKYLVTVGFIGVPPAVVPVTALLVFDFKIESKAEAEATMNLSFAYRQDFNARFGLTYSDASGLDWVKSFTPTSPDLSGDIGLGGKFSLELTLVPEVRFLVYGCAGISASIQPRVEVEYGASTSGVDGKLTAGVDFTLAPAGWMLDLLFSDEELSIQIWEGEWPLNAQTLAFKTHPESKTVAPGANASFTCTVDSSSPPQFQWFHNSLPVPGQTARSLFLTNVTTRHAGGYFVRATAGGLSIDSNTATLTVQTVTPANQDNDNDGLPNVVETNTWTWVSGTNTGTNPNKWDTDGDGLRDGAETHTGIYVSSSNTGSDPNKWDTDGDGRRDGAPFSGMARIPAGSFSMGDSFTEGDSDERPVHTVYVSAFYMQTTETTKAQWDEVRAWGLGNGYTDLPAGSVIDTTNYSKGASHPVFFVSWNDCVKWCNARSQKEGRTPCYTVSGTTYKAGSSAPDCNFSANGYRLPTEAEWEKAARGGASGHRFPWSDTNTITHSRANYFSEGWWPYDVSPTREYHPTYNDGTWFFTSPVGSFAPNGYGLYDMAGNVWEWCNDWYSSSYYSTSPGSDPPGPAGGSNRGLRGGGWYYYEFFCRVANRHAPYPDYSDFYYGFRCVRR